MGVVSSGLGVEGNSGRFHILQLAGPQTPLLWASVESEEGRNRGYKVTLWKLFYSDSNELREYFRKARIGRMETIRFTLCVRIT